MEKRKCDECGGQGMFVHSGCCCKHFEGVVLENGEMIAVCEKCGLYCGHIVVNREFNGKKYWLGE